MPAKSLKAADKQNILKKLTTEMKRRYGNSVPKQNRSVLETLLFAICLEDAHQDEAETASAALLEPFFDLNEIRVSSVAQIELALGSVPGAGWKALRIRETLQHLFEKFYAFDLEFLKRKTQEQAIKELAQIPYQTPFVRNYVIQHILGAHVLPLDQSMLNSLQWLGLVESGMDLDVAAEEVKAGLKKVEGVQFCHLLKCTSVDRELRDHFAEPLTAEDDTDPFTAAARLADLIKNPQKKKKKAKPAAAAPKPSPAKSSSAKPPASKTGVAKAVAVKKPAKKPADRVASGKTKPETARKVTKKVPAVTKKKTSRGRGK